jgi:ubiquinone/menaquinone biosynthesis C-methylase UbiE
MPRVDYDQIAHLYDEPLRQHPVDERLIAFLAARPDLRPADLSVLDVGCGTGTQLAANRAALPDAMLVGVDPFRGMLRVGARRETAVDWVQGDGARLPLVSSTFDYATNQFSYHHIADQPSFFCEISRVLRPGGRFVLTNIDPWSMPDWAIYRYFPESRDQDERDFRPAVMLAASMQEAELVAVRFERRTVQRRQSLAEFLAYASERHRTSQFIAMSDVAYEGGLGRLRDDVAADTEGLTSIDLGVCLLTLTADKPLN